MLVEDAGTGTSLCQDLRRSLEILVRGLRPKSDKVTRLAVQSAVIEQGRVHLPEHAHWLDDFFKEILSFPGSKNDDQVDSVELFLRFINSSRGRPNSPRPQGRSRPQGGSRPEGRTRPQGRSRGFNARAHINAIKFPWH